jgi:CRISPR-associated protein (TIGR03986 family)
MNPKHIKKIDNPARIARAPYNFVELPEKIVEAELQCDGKLRNNDRYHLDRHTGRIECTLTTESPLYIRCGLTPSDFSNFGDTPNEDLTPEQRKKKAEFFQHPSNLLHPVLPGSSLRGMLRTLVEIISFGKIERVSDQQKFFFRAVAAENDDPLRDKYKDHIGNMAKNVQSGYLECDKKQNKWFVRPSQKIDEQLFIEVKEEDIKDALPSLILMKKANYIPQYIQISFEVTETSINVSDKLNKYSSYKGWLVTSGNMLENLLEKTTEQEREKLLQKKEGRKYHYIVGEADSSATRLEISPDAIQNYRDALTNFQKGKEKQFQNNPKNRFTEKMGVLQEGLPIFYCEPQNGQSIVTLFGQSPNFRIPYSPNNDGKAASAVDFIPKEVGESDVIDLADAIFGFVRGKKDKIEQNTTDKTKEKREQSRAGRIFVSDAHTGYKADKDDTITPQILASPKPTTFQHYLVQTTQEKPKLKHYASKPNEETVIRGHKLYWHKGNVSKDKIQADATKAEIEEKRSQYTEIKPIKQGVSFEFTIQFENLSDVELGALLWILTLSNDEANQLKLLNLDGKEKYRLSLGMGKPLGMGSVMLEKSKLVLNERHKNEQNQRYTKLFDGDSWLIGDREAWAPLNRPATDDEYIRYLQKFETYIITNLDEADLPEDCTDRQNLRLKDVPRIQMLLAMLSWNFPPANETLYMEIERKVSKGYLGKKNVKPNEETKDEYEDRLVLPTPLQVKGWESRDKRKFTDLVQPSPSALKSSSKQGNTNPAMERGKKPPKNN